MQEAPRPNAEIQLMRAWEAELKQLLSPEIKAGTAMVNSSADGSILEATTKGGYTRIVYDANSKEKEGPFRVYPLHSKDEFYATDEDHLWSAPLSKDGVERQILLIKHEASTPPEAVN